MTPIPAVGAPRVVNALTIDVEDYFHVSAFDDAARRERWGSFESRVCANTERLLNQLAEASVSATFFVLGWVAERHPGLVRRIAAAGHELASHGYAHRLVYDMTPASFRDDLRRAKDAIACASGVEIVGYRAPSFSITRRSLWALDVLIEEGYAFDSSVFPVRRDRYGLPGAPRFAHEVVRPAGRLLEIPPSTIRLAGMTLPVCGGGYFRLYPYGVTRRAIDAINRGGQPAIVYLHPWEIDPAQPRQDGSAVSRFRHYVNLDLTESRLRRMLTDFAFGPITTAVGRRQAGRLAVPTDTRSAVALRPSAARAGS